MKMRSRRRSNFIDGFINVYQPNEKTTNFGAKKNVKTLDDLTFIVKLAFEEQYRRHEDLEFAEANNRTLSLKVKTRLYKGVQTNHKVIVDNVLYDIIDIDIDKFNQEMFIYLEYVKEVVIEDE